MNVTIQGLVLDHNSLNQAYLQVKRNKGVAGIDDMTADNPLPCLKENKMELLVYIKANINQHQPNG